LRLVLFHFSFQHNEQQTENKQVNKQTNEYRRMVSNFRMTREEIRHHRLDWYFRF